MRELVEAGIPILTVEDHGRIGGFGSRVLEACNDARLPTERIFRMGAPDRWVYHGSRKENLEDADLNAAAIARTVRQILDGSDARPPLDIHVDVKSTRVTR